MVLVLARVPPSVTKEAADHYQGSGSVIEYKEYAGRSHYTVGQDGWQQVADDALVWAVDHAVTAEAQLAD